MLGFLKMAFWILVLAAVALAIGFVIERFRQRGLRSWAERLGGTFEAGSPLGTVLVPEAESFDRAGTQGPGEARYHSVARIPRDGATYVLAYYCRTYEFDRKTRSARAHVAFATVPGADLPAVGVQEKWEGPIALARPPALPFHDALPAFSAKFEVRALQGADPPAPETLARLLTAEVQETLLASSDLLANLEARGGMLRLQAADTLASTPYEELLALAERLVALLRR